MELEHEPYVSVTIVRKFVVGKVADVDTVNLYRAGISLIKCPHYLEKGGFSCTAGANDADNFALIDLQVYTLQHLKGAKSLCYILYGNHVAKVRIFDETAKKKKY